MKLQPPKGESQLIMEQIKSESLICRLFNRMILLRSLLICHVSLIVCLNSLSAQKISLESAVYQGVVWRHTPKLTTKTGEGISGQELGIRFQTLGRRDWQVWQRYPSLGGVFACFQLGENAHERAFGLLPWLNVPILRAAWFSAHFRISTGLAWVTKPYDWWNNPGQNAIGSHWNNMTQFRLAAEARLSAHTRLLLGGSFTHFSNGGMSLPNYGINVLSGWVGATWSPKPLRKADFKAAGTSRKLGGRRLGGLLQGGFSAIQIATFDGPKYPVWSGSAAVLYRFNKLHRASFGLDYEQNKAIYAWGLHSTRFDDEAAARQGATRLALFLGEEFLFGDLGIQLQLGRYFGGKYNAFVPKSLYSKLSIRWYLPESIPTPVRPFLGATLKTHAFTAEYIAWNLGLAF